MGPIRRKNNQKKASVFGNLVDIMHKYKDDQLRRPTNNGLEAEEVYSYYGSDIPITTLNIEEQKQQLFGICKMIQVQLKGGIERIAKIIRLVEADSGEPKSLFEEYEQKVWPIIVETDLHIKILANTVRQTIDACNINERRLEWLLAIHKFQLKIEEMIRTLTTIVKDDIKRVLSLHVRCGKGRITGLHFNPNTIEVVQRMQNDIRIKSFENN